MNNEKLNNVLWASTCLAIYFILSYLRINSMALFRDGLWLEIQNASLCHYMNRLWASDYLLKWIYIVSFAVIVWSRIRMVTKIVILVNLSLLTAFFFWGVHLAYLFPTSTQERNLIKMYFVDLLHGQLFPFILTLTLLAIHLLMEIKNSIVGEAVYPPQK